jgi:hypothetical protein
MGARRLGGKDEAAQDAESFGAPAEVIEKIAASERNQAEEIGIWPENEAVVNAFSMVLSQWNVASIGGAMVAGGMMPGRLIYLGLNYAGVAACLAGSGVAQTAELWDGIRAMEGAARAVLNGDPDSDDDA